MTIDNQRKKLSEITKEILRLLNQREEIVSQIQSLKIESKQKSWNPKQEIQIFTNYIENLEDISLKKVLWLSLLIEMHCENWNSRGVYPSGN